MILVLGFGPFGDVMRNPSEVLAGRLDGRRVGGHTIVGRTMPVSFRRSVGLTCALARRLEPEIVLGIGVAVGRENAEYERRGTNRVGPDRPDVDGASPVSLEAEGPVFRESRFPADTNTIGRRAGFSGDAGDYVCNAWLYGVLGGLPDTRVGFLHIPIQGYGATPVLDTLLAGLGQKT